MENPNEMTATDIILELQTINSRMIYHEKRIPITAGGAELEAMNRQQAADMKRIPVLQAELSKRPQRLTLTALFDPVVESAIREDFPGFSINSRIEQCNDLNSDRPDYAYSWLDNRETAPVYQYLWNLVWILKVAYFPRADILLWFLSPVD